MESSKLENIKKLLIVVDMINGFVREGMMADPYIEHIIPTQLTLIQQFLNAQEGVVFVKDCHEIECREFNYYPKHCVKGTKESDLVDAFLPYEKEGMVIEKNSTSAMFAPGFLESIQKMTNLKEVVIVGCCTDICVMNLALPLQNYFDQVNRYVSIIVPKDAVETYDSPTHSRSEYNEMAFTFLRQAGIVVVDTWGKE